MIEFGNTLRKAREAKGMSAKDLANATHLMARTVDELENENFSHIAAPIYGRGFVKLYCEAVGLDPRPLIDEFMAIYSGERPPAASPLGDEPAPESEPAAPEAPPVSDTQFAPAAEVLPAPEPESEPDLFTAAANPPRAPIAPEPAPSPFSRFAPVGYAEEEPPAARRLVLPPNLGRIALVAAGAIIIVLMLVFGIRAAYRLAMSPAQPQQEQPASAEKQPEAKTSEKSATPTKAPAAATPVKREGVKLPAFYAD